MKDFNINRFKSFALYDLTINQKYYRSQAMITIFTLMGIALTCFLFRWMICDIDDISVPFMDYRNTSATTAIMAAVISIITIVLAGCSFHNLLTKQGRISELTLPATSLEKFTWHVCLNVFGGILLCMVGLLCADALNAVLMAMTFPLDAQHSLFLEFVNTMSLNKFESAVTQLPAISDFARTMVQGSLILLITSTIFQLSIFVYGNSIKYRNNIIWTYAIMQAISIVIVIVFVGIIKRLAWSNFPEPTADDIKTLVYLIIYGLSALQAVMTVLLLWRAYVRYTKAVITSKRNK